VLDFAIRLVAVVNLDPQLTEIKRERMVSRVVGGSGQEAHNPRKRARTLDFRGCGLVGLLTGGGGGAVECGKSPRTSARARFGGLSMCGASPQPPKSSTNARLQGLWACWVVERRWRRRCRKSPGTSAKARFGPLSMCGASPQPPKSSANARLRGLWGRCRRARGRAPTSEIERKCSISGCGGWCVLVASRSPQPPKSSTIWRVVGLLASKSAPEGWGRYH